MFEPKKVRFSTTVVVVLVVVVTVVALAGGTPCVGTIGIDFWLLMLASKTLLSNGKMTNTTKKWQIGTLV
jgi:hypothetical protein